MNASLTYIDWRRKKHRELRRVVRSTCDIERFAMTKSVVVASRPMSSTNADTRFAGRPWRRLFQLLVQSPIVKYSINPKVVIFNDRIKH